MADRTELIVYIALAQTVFWMGLSKQGGGQNRLHFNHSQRLKLNWIVFAEIQTM